MVVRVRLWHSSGGRVLADVEVIQLIEEGHIHGCLCGTAGLVVRDGMNAHLCVCMEGSSPQMDWDLTDLQVSCDELFHTHKYFVKKMSCKNMNVCLNHVIAECGVVVLQSLCVGVHQYVCGTC